MSVRHVAVLATGVLLLPVAALAAGTSPSDPTRFDVSALDGEIPPVMLAAYLDAADRWEIDWALLAAIGKVECDHGRYPAPGRNPPGTINHAGARGPMQFPGSTWRATAGRYDLDVAGPPAPDGRGYATDGDGDGIADPWNPHDAAHAAARFLVALGGRDDPRRAARGGTQGDRQAGHRAADDQSVVPGCHRAPQGSMIGSDARCVCGLWDRSTGRGHAACGPLG